MYDLQTGLINDLEVSEGPRFALQDQKNTSEHGVKGVHTERVMDGVRSQEGNGGHSVPA